ncbi:MAG: DHA2 family efflux MFS transporter permease subunit [Pseudomonadota bacterium]
MSASDVAIAPAAPAAPARPTGIRFVLLVTFATLATTAYDFTWTVVAVALPHMQGTFSTTSDQIAWVLIAFMVGSAVMTASTGWFSARFGRKNLFLFATAGYTISLVGCGMSETLIEASVWRFAQGLVGASLIPLGQAIVVDAFPPERHGQATSIWGIGVMLGSVAGPIGGGFLLEYYSWPWVFYITIPVGIIALIGAWIFVPSTPADRTRHFDWVGFTTLVVGASLLQLALARGERQDWFDSAEVIIEMMAALILLYLFAVHTVFAKKPFVDRALFLDRNYMTGMVFIAVIGALIVLPNFLMPLMLQQIGGYPPIETGRMMMWRGGGILLGLILVGRIAHRINPRSMIIFGLVLMAVPAWYMAQWTVEIRTSDVMWTNAVQGFGGSFIWVPLSTLTLSGLAKRNQDQGYALFYLVFELGSSVGVAAIVGKHSRDSQTNHAILTEAIHPFNQLFGYAPVERALDLADPATLALLEAEIQRQSVMIAYNNAFFATCLMAAALIPAVFIFRRRSQATPEAVTTLDEPPAPEPLPTGADR